MTPHSGNNTSCRATSTALNPAGVSMVFGCVESRGRRRGRGSHMLRRTVWARSCAALRDGRSCSGPPPSAPCSGSRNRRGLRVCHVARRPVRLPVPESQRSRHAAARERETHLNLCWKAAGGRATPVGRSRQSELQLRPGAPVGL